MTGFAGAAPARAVTAINDRTANNDFRCIILISVVCLVLQQLHHGRAQRIACFHAGLGIAVVMLVMIVAGIHHIARIGTSVGPSPET